MHKLARLAALTLLITLAIPAAARRMSPGDEVARKVRLYVEARDCSSAVARLTEGVAKKYPEVNMLAGAMFEHGVCVKADWDRAVGFYSNAFDGGHKAAMYSLMSGFAAPEHGPDMAAALWWATGRRTISAAALAGSAPRIAMTRTVSSKSCAAGRNSA